MTPFAAFISMASSSSVKTPDVGKRKLKVNPLAEIESSFVFSLVLFFFYQKEINHRYMQITINLAVSFGIGGLIASLGIFFSSFEAIRKSYMIGFLLYMPDFPFII